MGALLRAAALGIQRRFNGFDPATRGPLRPYASEAHHPIFVIGAPRTGSTLLYQTMIQQLRVSYISNLMGLVPNRMTSIARLSRRAMARPRDLRESDYGYVPGLFSPSEAGAVFRRWFDRDLPEADRVRVRNTFAMLSAIAEAPVLTKNLMNSLRLPIIHEVLPEARFIHVRRDPLFTAQSLWLARRKHFGNDRKWFSAEPPGFEAVRHKPPAYQVVWQVREIEAGIAQFIAGCSAPVIVVNYEDLCGNPGSVLRTISESCGTDRRDVPAPAPSTASNAIALTPAEWAELERHHGESSG